MLNWTFQNYLIDHLSMKEMCSFRTFLVCLIRLIRMEMQNNSWSVSRKFFYRSASIGENGTTKNTCRAPCLLHPTGKDNDISLVRRPVRSPDESHVLFMSACRLFVVGLIWPQAPRVTQRSTGAVSSAIKSRDTQIKFLLDLQLT